MLLWSFARKLALGPFSPSSTGAWARWGRANMPSETLGKGGALRHSHLPQWSAASSPGESKAPSHAFSLQQAVTLKKLPCWTCLSQWLVSMLLLLIALYSSSENPHGVSKYQKLPKFAECLFFSSSTNTWLNQTPELIPFNSCGGFTRKKGLSAYTCHCSSHVAFGFGVYTWWSEGFNPLLLPCPNLAFWPRKIDFDN